MSIPEHVEAGALHWMSRWIAERGFPALKCERIGHRLQGEWRRGYIPGENGYFGGVAQRTKEVREVCARCGVETLPWTPVESERRTLHSLTAPSDGWDKINAGGWWIEHGRCAPPSSAKQTPNETPGIDTK